MGILANSVLAHGGSVEGVIPDLIEEMQLAYRGLTRMVKVPDLESRKKYLIEHADLLLALPGGYGTIDEFFTAAVSNQLGIIDKPLILFNVQNFYNPLIEQLDRMTALGFIKKEFRERVKVITRCDELDLIFVTGTLEGVAFIQPFSNKRSISTFLISPIIGRTKRGGTSPAMRSINTSGRTVQKINDKIYVVFQGKRNK